MATYKVIQDIEADDKLIWMFSFRQFVYAFISVIFMFASYLFIAKHVAFLNIFSVPVVIFTGVLAYPFGKDQPTEVWVLAKVRYFIKPKRRIWSQDGAKELVTITVPKKVEVNLTDNLSQNEVRSKLQALANTIDTRGWAIKNVGLNYSSSIYLDNNDGDRLISPVIVSDDPSEEYVSTSEDIMDEKANPLAQKMQSMIDQKEKQHKQQILAELQNIDHQAPLVNKPIGSEPPILKNNQAIDENKISNQLKYMDNAQHLSLSHLRDIDKLQEEQKNQQLVQNSSTQKEKQKSIPNPDIIKLSNRDDLKISVLDNEINKKKLKGPDPKEVVISLHN